MSNRDSPKETAEQIIDNFRDGILTFTVFNDRESLVICAIIHVKGIIEATKIITNDLDLSDVDAMNVFVELSYWQQVLTELNQM